MLCFIVDKTLIDLTTIPNRPFEFHLYDAADENHYRYNAVGLVSTEAIDSILDCQGTPFPVLCFTLSILISIGHDSCSF